MKNEGEGARSKGKRRKRQKRNSRQHCKAAISSVQLLSRVQLFVTP